MWLASTPEGRSVKHLLGELDIPEPELRETLRKLDAAGLAHRVKGTWVAVPLEGSDPSPDASRQPLQPARLLARGDPATAGAAPRPSAARPC